MIQAKVIADSKNEFGNRITTMVVTMPRFILAEFNTHRMFSRNSASSRAIPFEKMLKSVEENPCVPIAWQKDHPGMQGTEYLDNANVKDWGFSVRLTEQEVAARSWLTARDSAVNMARALYNRQQLNVTKQLCNRLLEPFMWHTVIVTATEWENFFALRCPKYVLETESSGGRFRSKKDAMEHCGIHPDASKDINWFNRNEGQAEIHMMALAEAMWDAYNESAPKELKAGEWHIPFGDDLDISRIVFAIGLNENYPAEKEPEGYRTKERFDEIIGLARVKIATARCAQVSYTVVGEEGKPMNYDKLIALHDRLAKSGHWSPFEHCAKAMSEDNRYWNVCGNGLSRSSDDYVELEEGALGWSGNFRGFIQYRKTFEGENIK